MSGLASSYHWVENYFSRCSGRETQRKTNKLHCRKKHPRIALLEPNLKLLGKSHV